MKTTTTTLLLCALTLLSPLSVLASQQSGGGYTVSGQMNAVSNTIGGNGFSSQASGNPVSNVVTGGGFSQFSGYVGSLTNAATTAAPSGGGGGGGGGAGGKIYCQITSNATEATVSGSPVTLTLIAKEPGVVLVLGGREYKSKDTAIVNPVGTAVYTATIKGKIDQSCSIQIKTVLPYGATSCLSLKRTYVIGVSAPEVRTIQKFLKSQGYAARISGMYDYNTARMTAFFQQKYAAEILGSQGFKKPTGIWGRATTKKAYELGLCPQTASEIKKIQVKPIILDKQPETMTDSVDPLQRNIVDTPECLAFRINPGTVSNDVKKIQTFLTKQGYKVPTQGRYESKTFGAIRDFQDKYAPEILESQGFKGGTGIWGLATAKKAATLGLCQKQ
jgi:Putative peptidoglycan binding domain